jgi:hypothetical protein
VRSHSKHQKYCETSTIFGLKNPGKPWVFHIELCVYPRIKTNSDTLRVFAIFFLGFFIAAGPKPSRWGSMGMIKADDYKVGPPR